MPECTGINFSSFFLFMFFYTILYFLNFFVSFLFSFRNIMLFTRFSRKVDLVLKMVSNMARHLGKRIGLMMNAW